MKIKLDAVDRKILKHLSDNSQIPLTELSEMVALSPTALHHRIKRLKSEKIIDRFSIILNPLAFEKYMLCFVRLIKFKRSSIDIASKLKLISEVEACFSVTGEESLLLKIRVGDTNELQQVLEKIGKIEGVERTLTSMVIEEHFDRSFILKN